jgi:hypothetical protein
VTKIVRADRGDAGLHQEGMPAPSECAWRDGSAIRHGEDVVAIFPSLARCLAPLSLSCRVGSEERDLLVREVDAARSVPFGASTLMPPPTLTWLSATVRNPWSRWVCSRRSPSNSPRRSPALSFMTAPRRAPPPGRARGTERVGGRVVEGDTLLQPARRPLLIALAIGQHPRPVERPRAHRLRDIGRAGGREGAHQPAPPLGQVAALTPEAGQRPGEAQPFLGPPRGVGPAQQRLVDTPRRGGRARSARSAKRARTSAISTPDAPAPSSAPTVGTRAVVVATPTAAYCPGRGPAGPSQIRPNRWHRAGDRCRAAWQR